MFIVASQKDAIWWDSKNPKSCIDLDDLFKVDCIKRIVIDHEENAVYFLSNKRFEKLGFFLIKFDASDPKRHRFLTLWKHKLEIDNCNIFLLRGIDNSTK